MTTGTGIYGWVQHYQARGLALGDHLEEAVEAMAAAGLKVVEPASFATGGRRELKPLLERHGVAAAQFYVNARLHEPDWKVRVAEAVDESVWAAAQGARTIVCNPEPIAWGSPADKDDAALRRQAEALATFGAALRERGLRLAYHSHDPEMRAGAREFHHMLVSVPAELMDLCLDVHWVFRGCGNSNVAVLDVIRLYGARVTSLHLRQSRRGRWVETLGEGDVDYPAVAAALRRAGFDGAALLETAYEEGTPKELPLVEVHRRGREAWEAWWKA